MIAARKGNWITYCVVAFDDVWFFYANDAELRKHIDGDAKPRQNGKRMRVFVAAG